MGDDPVTVLVSACLLGVDCTYQGGNERRDDLVAALGSFRVVPVCPEVLGGLGTPRPRSEIEGGDGGAVLDGHARVRTDEGGDVTEAFVLGARSALAAAAAAGARIAVLKDRSPSCGCRGVYDGTHSRTLRPDGVGVAAALLARAGVETLTEAEAAGRLRHT